MNVLSLFDGMSNGQIALEGTRINVDKYYASEIKEDAIKVTQHNYPNTVQLGSVTEIDDKRLNLFRFTIHHLNILVGTLTHETFHLS